MSKSRALIASAALLSACASAPHDPSPAHGPSLEEMIRSVVRIEDSMEHFNHGTGVYIGDGYILTAAHVATAWNDRKVVEFYGHRGYWNTEFVWRDPVTDIALIRVPKGQPVPPDVPAARMRCGAVDYDEPITMIGYPLNFPLSVVHGRLMSPVETGDDREIVASIPTAPGNSGSPMFDEHGLVIGVLSKLEIGEVGGMPYLMPYGYIAKASPACNKMAGGLS